MRRLQNLGLVLTLLLVCALAASALLGLVAGEAAPEPDPVEELIDGGRLRVEVLNGSAVPGLARTATRVLRRQNFDVVFFGNATGGAGDSSVVIDRVGRPEDARRVAEALGISRVRSEPDTSLYLEATVIVGRDWSYSGLAGASEPPDEP